MKALYISRIFKLRDHLLYFETSTFNDICDGNLCNVQNHFYLKFIFLEQFTVTDLNSNYIRLLNYKIYDILSTWDNSNDD